MRISDWSSDVCSSDLGTFELATAMLFDIGVAVTVVGAVMLALAELSHIAQRAEKEERIDDEPMDVDPARPRKAPACAWRAEARRVGKECVSTGRSRWSPDP